MAQLVINGIKQTVSADPDTPVLWVLRDMGLTGTKYGCGVAQCGACTVHADGQPIRSCSTPIEALSGVKITTIEGLGGEHALQARNGQCKRAPQGVFARAFPQEHRKANQLPQ